jgi:hypothetical protein
MSSCITITKHSDPIKAWSKKILNNEILLKEFERLWNLSNPHNLYAEKMECGMWIYEEKLTKRNWYQEFKYFNGSRKLSCNIYPPILYKGFKLTTFFHTHPQSSLDGWGFDYDKASNEDIRLAKHYKINGIIKTHGGYVLFTPKTKMEN